MSRLRRLVLSDRFFFLTVKLLPRRRLLDDRDFAVLARCLNAVRSRQRFLLTAWVFLPDHWHAILFPPHPLTVSEAMKSLKLASINSLGRARREAGELWQRLFPSLGSETMLWERSKWVATASALSRRGFCVFIWAKEPTTN